VGKLYFWKKNIVLKYGLNMILERLIDLPQWVKERFPKDNHFSVKRNGQWENVSTDEFIENSELLSLALIKKGINSGDKIATVSNNRPEWNFADMAILQLGAIHVPIYPTISRDDFLHILSHSETRILFVSSEDHYNNAREIISSADLKIEIYTFDEVEGARNWKELLNEGREFRSPESLAFLKHSRDIVHKDDVATIIYTSGTTGTPKGVMLSHWNIISNFSGDREFTVIKEGDRSISFLPLCHVLERTGNYMFQYYGASIHYAESIDTISDDIKYVKPHFFITVPRLLEKIYDRINATAKNLPLHKKIIFYWALKVGLKFSYERNEQFLYSLKLKIARKLVFSKWQEALGGNVRFIVSGGAPLQERLERVFRAAGMNVQNGYGLTETSPIIAANRYLPPAFRFGSVGTVASNVTVKVAEDGEILVKGPNVMKGYYKEPELTAEAFDDEGWFRTGDIGKFEDGKYLVITDRKKELLKTSGGKYVAPQVIENKFKESDFIEQIMVVGEGMKYISAIIVPNFTFLHNWCAIKKLNYSSNEKLIRMKTVVKRFQDEIDRFNENFGQVEKIKKFMLTSIEWTPGNSYLSPTLKLKRNVLQNFYKKEILTMYK